jgi:hypothetical protein
MLEVPTVVGTSEMGGCQQDDVEGGNRGLHDSLKADSKWLQRLLTLMARIILRRNQVCVCVCRPPPPLRSPLLPPEIHGGPQTCLEANGSLFVECKKCRQ